MKRLAPLALALALAVPALGQQSKPENCDAKGEILEADVESETLTLKVGDNDEEFKVAEGVSLDGYNKGEVVSVRCRLDSEGGQTVTAILRTR